MKCAKDLREAGIASNHTRVMGRASTEESRMERVKQLLMAMIAVVAIGTVGAGAAGAHSTNHGAVTMVTPGGNATCEFGFSKTNWSGATDKTSQLSAVSTGTCDFTSLETYPANSTLTLTRYAGGFADLTGGILVVMPSFLGPIPCAYDLDNVFGTWSTVSGGYAVLFSNSSTATRLPGGPLCPSPADVVSTGSDLTFLHTDAL